MDKEEVVDVSANEVIEAIREEISDEIADLEDYARRGEAPPHCRGYKIKVNGDPFVVHDRYITGREVLELRQEVHELRRKLLTAAVHADRQLVFHERQLGQLVFGGQLFG